MGQEGYRQHQVTRVTTGSRKREREGGRESKKEKGEREREERVKVSERGRKPAATSYLTTSEANP